MDTANHVRCGFRYDDQHPRNSKYHRGGGASGQLQVRGKADFDSECMEQYLPLDDALVDLGQVEAQSFLHGPAAVASADNVHAPPQDGAGVTRARKGRCALNTFTKRQHASIRVQTLASQKTGLNSRTVVCACEIMLHHIMENFNFEISDELNKHPIRQDYIVY